jgi:hypothetical protein
MLRLPIVMPSRNVADDVEHRRTSFDMAARLDATRAFIGYGPVTHNSEPGLTASPAATPPPPSTTRMDTTSSFHCMDTRDNYWTRHGARAGSQRI